MEHRRRDEVRDAVKAPGPKAGEPGLAEPAVELASREEPERRVARVVDPDALAQRTRERSGGLTRRDAVPEWVAGDARREPPEEIEAPAVLDLEQDPAPRPEDAGDLDE